MFETLDFNQNIKNQLSQAASSGRLPHALILEGSDSRTRERAAIEIAQAVLCSGAKAPCGVCPSCKKVDHLSHPDLHILRKEEKAVSIKVDEIRLFRSQAQLMPNDGDKSVFIILEAQDMNVMAQNALLKIFEEPSGHVTFILTAPSKSAFLDTVISRGTIYSLSSETEEGEKSETQKQADEFAADFADRLIKGDEFGFITDLVRLKKDRDLFGKILVSFSSLLRDALILKNGLPEYVPESSQIASSLSDLPTKRLLNFIRAADKAKHHLEANGNFNLLTHKFSSELFKS